MQRLLLELRSLSDPGRFVPVPSTAVVKLVTTWRNEAVARLVGANFDPAIVDAVLVGRRTGTPAPSALIQRVRVVPLPSIGHAHADRLIRRLVVEIPRSGPVTFDDLRWAWVGLTHGDVILVEGEDHRMLDHYARTSRTFITVTPAALPAVRRRIDPIRIREEAKRAPERHDEETAARHAVHQALRHANINAHALEVDVCREPATPHGTPAEVFHYPPRFDKHRLWHVCLTLDRPVTGPLVIGDGRFLGLGLLRPRVARRSLVLAFSISGGLVGSIDPLDLARHLRRAVLARAQRVWGSASLPPTITGHKVDGKPASDHRHLMYLVDPVAERLIVYLPAFHSASAECLTEALAHFTTLRAGRMGVLDLVPNIIDESDPLFAPARIWRSLTPYRLERHRHRGVPVAAAIADLTAACAGLPLEHVEVGDVHGQAGIGVDVFPVKLTFRHAVDGPLALGKTRHIGGGVFVGSRGITEPCR